jgi:hypothetical protein
MTKPLTNAERQARYREKHLEGVDGEKERAQFVFDVGTKKRLAKIAAHFGYKSSTDLIEQWAMQTVSDIDEGEERKTKEQIIRRHRKSA